MTKDFKDMLRVLFEEGVEFLLVGAYALAAHGYPRATGDMDIWVRCSADNAKRVWNSLIKYRAPLLDLTPEDLETPDVVFQIGVAPQRIDILTSIAGVSFDMAWDARAEIELGGMQVPVIGVEQLIANKKATGRPKDQADATWLESELSNGQTPSVSTHGDGEE